MKMSLIHVFLLVVWLLTNVFAINQEPKEGVDLVSYVLESFEVEDDSSGAAEEQLLPYLDVVHGKVVLSSSSENRAKFGSHALALIGKPVKDTSDSGSEQGTGGRGRSAVQVQSILPNVRVHQARGARYLSVWYNNRRHSTELTLLLKVTLFDNDGRNDQEGCNSPNFFRKIHNNCNETNFLEGWSHQVQLVSPSVEEEGEWFELRIPTTTMLPWRREENSSSGGNGVLDLNHIKGWSIEIEVKNNGRTQGVSNSAFTVWIDQIALIGGGEMLGSVFFSGYDNESFNPLDNIKHTKSVPDDSLRGIYHASNISLHETTQEFTPDGKFIVDYVIQHKEVWGGFIQYQHIVPGRAYYNLSSSTTMVAMDLQVLIPPNAPTRPHLRFLLLDSSDCWEDCWMYSGFNLENYYSFQYVLGTAGKRNVSIELRGDGLPASPFFKTGWYGTEGNSFLDKSTIKGFKYEVAIDTVGEMDSIVTGSFELSNLRVTSQELSTAEANEMDAKCVREPNLYITNTSNFRIIDFIDPSSCCEACQLEPTCKYAFSDKDWLRCFISDRVQAGSIEFIHSFEPLSLFFWKDTAEARGNYCDVCDCYEKAGTIDCRGRDLTILPKMNQSTSWTPRILDLRGNPNLSMIGTGALDDLPSLREMRLPTGLRYFAPAAKGTLNELNVVTSDDDDSDNFNPNANAVSDTTAGDRMGTNFLLKSTAGYADICCGRGQHVPLTIPSDGLTFCDFRPDTPGADAVYEDFIQYEGSEEIFFKLTSKSKFLSEAAESVEKCAEYCNLRPECRYFDFDQRSTLTSNICKLLGDQGTPKKICCHKEHHADSEATIPGHISGYIPRTRRDIDNACVLVETDGILVADESNQFTTHYEVSLGSAPTRGAVWVDPVLSVSTDVDVSFLPERVVLYDNETSVLVQVTLSNLEAASSGGTVFVTHEVQACDEAFSGPCPSADDEIVYIEFVLPQEGSSNTTMVIILSSLAAVAFVSIIASMVYLRAERKRREADQIWQVHKSELKFNDPPVVIGRGSFGYVLQAEYRGTCVAVKRVIPRREGRIKSPGPMTRFGAFDSKGLASLEVVMGKVSLASVPVSDVEMGESGFDSSGTVVASRYAQLLPKQHRGDIGSKVWQNLSRTKKQEDFVRLRNKFIEEMRYLSKLRHPCITTVMGAVISRTDEPMLIMEFMDHGSLYDLVHNETMMLDGEQTLAILKDVTQGIRFLHSATPQIIHGDLKSANILVDSKFRAKVADFGLSQKASLGITGTPYWMAPENLGGMSRNTTKSDVFSFGIILYELYSRREPYEGEEFAHVVKQIIDPDIRKRPIAPDTMPPEIKTLMAGCLRHEPSQRLDFQALDIALKRFNVADVEHVGSLNKRRPSMRHVTNKLLHDVFPPHVAQALQEGRKIEPESHDMVTIFFSDIVGFTNISATRSPIQVADLLDRLYLRVDSLSREHDIFKVETIGDSWMGVTNLVKEQPDHTARAARFAVDFLAAANDTLIDPNDESLGRVQVRIGFHSGPVVANIVGSRNPRYCLFGDTVNTASRMESHSEMGRIHCSEQSAALLIDQDPSVCLESRGFTNVKGKGLMPTYWVGDTVQEKDCPSQVEEGSFMSSSLAEPPPRSPWLYEKKLLL